MNVGTFFGLYFDLKFESKGKNLKKTDITWSTKVPTSTRRSTLH